GDYPSLDRQFNDRISSAREVGAYGNRTGTYGNYGRGIIKFFDEPLFRGRSLDLQRDTVNFRERGYNDRASSIIVSEGVWELCSDAGYTGNCRRFGPGRYADLGQGMADRVSSARLVRDVNAAPARLGGGWGGAPRNTEGQSRVILYGEEGLRGPSMAVSDTMTNLQVARFNDAAASMLVEGGPWLVCSDSGFGGNCRVFSPGRYEQLRDTGLSRAISSVRPTSPEPVGRRWGGSEGVQLYTQRDFGGDSRNFPGDVPNLGGSGFNDRVGSMVVNGGEWELCSEAGYAGSCMVVGPGAYGNLGGLSAQMSSIRRLR
ncbi:MAG TPA: beta/gamma crystallin-related protein, partial [Albitalea sp.]|nr:beta/gamma crystallin-related protein [Albitalea sp.]